MISKKTIALFSNEEREEIREALTTKKRELYNSLTWVKEKTSCNPEALQNRLRRVEYLLQLF